MQIKPIAYIYTDFPTKFGLPRQSGIVEGLKGKIVMEPAFRDPEALKGLEGFSYIWLLWDFSMAHRESWSATVCPPRLGGKVHMGVFATRSPFRPNSIGLSSVRLEGIECTEKETVVYVSGIDMMSGTPVYDIKPYIPDFDSHPDALRGFTGGITDREFNIYDPEGLIPGSPLTEDEQQALIKLLREDPRPRYDAADDGSRRYGFYYCGLDIRFTVNDDVLRIVEIVSAGGKLK